MHVLLVTYLDPLGGKVPIEVVQDARSGDAHTAMRFDGSVRSLRMLVAFRIFHHPSFCGVFPRIIVYIL
jgi:hypothetical protein